MNVDIGAEAALFPEKDYINGIAVAVRGGGTYRRQRPRVLKLLRAQYRFLWCEINSVVELILEGIDSVRRN